MGPPSIRAAHVLRYPWVQRRMTYIVNENCIKCKFTDCVEVCPVDCFYEGENMLVIHPDECIDCGVCEPECPVEAIKPDTEAGLEKWLELNREYSEKWPNITSKKKRPRTRMIFEMKRVNLINTSATSQEQAISRDVRVQKGWQFSPLGPRAAAN